MDDQVFLDRDFLKRYRNGDPQTLKAVYLGYLPLVKAILVRTGRRLTPADVDDLIQQTFVKVFKKENREGFNPLYSFSGYISTAARNNLKDLYKRQAPSLIEAKDDAAYEYQIASVPDGGLSPEETVLSREEKEIMAHFVNTLEKGLEQGVFLLYFKQGQVEEVVAEELHTTRHQVRKQIDRLKIKVYRYLKEKKMI